MVNHKNRYEVFKVNSGETYICEISSAGENEYIGHDTVTGYPVVALNNNDIVELMFMHEIERRSELTGRTELVVSVVEWEVFEYIRGDNIDDRWNAFRHFEWKLQQK